MERFYLRPEDEYIKLGQLLKACNLVESGAMAKEEILDGHVKVNGKPEYQRGKKIKPQDMIEYADQVILVCR